MVEKNMTLLEKIVEGQIKASFFIGNMSVQKRTSDLGRDLRIHLAAWVEAKKSILPP